MNPTHRALICKDINGAISIFFRKASIVIYDTSTVKEDLKKIGEINSTTAYQNNVMGKTSTFMREKINVQSQRTQARLAWAEILGFYQLAKFLSSNPAWLS